jgi:hypothetical protein
MPKIFKVPYVITGNAFVYADDATEAENALYDLSPEEIVEDTYTVEFDVTDNAQEVPEEKAWRIMDPLGLT